MLAANHPHGAKEEGGAARVRRGGESLASAVRSGVRILRIGLGAELDAVAAGPPAPGSTVLQVLEQLRHRFLGAFWPVGTSYGVEISSPAER